MDEVIKVDTIDRYNQLFGFETLHPLVAVVDLSMANKWPPHYRFNYGLYCVYLKDSKCGNIRYGRQDYDYEEGSIIGFAPGQVATKELENGVKPAGVGILFHPDLIHGTSLGHDIQRYSFFSYESNEALHLSEDEREVILDCIRKINLELERGIDRHTNRLIAKNIELLLDYCMRYFDRQFNTRSEANKDIISRFEYLLEEYCQGDTLKQQGLPTVKYFAEKVYLSPNYFGDLIKKETGKTAQEYIQNKLMEIAKEWILSTNKTFSQIAYELGFQYTQHFNRTFKKNVGYTPTEYRKLQS